MAGRGRRACWGLGTERHHNHDVRQIAVEGGRVFEMDWQAAGGGASAALKCQHPRRGSVRHPCNSK